MSSCRRELCIGLILNSITYRSLDLCIPTTFSIAEGQDLITYVDRSRILLSEPLTDEPQTCRTYGESTEIKLLEGTSYLGSTNKCVLFCSPSRRNVVAELYTKKRRPIRDLILTTRLRQCYMRLLMSKLCYSRFFESK